MVRNFWSRTHGPRKCSPAPGFAMSVADRVVVATDRSTNQEDSGPRGLKCDKIRGLETCNPANFQSRLFECSLAREKHTNLQELHGF